MNISFTEDEQIQKHMKGYHCLYQYGNRQLTLDYDLMNGVWTMSSIESDSKDKEYLNILFEDLNSTRKYSLKEQIQIIIKRLDHYFDGKYNAR